MTDLGRCEFLTLDTAAMLAGSGVGATAAITLCTRRPPALPSGRAHQTLRIGAGGVELAPGRVVPTTAYIGQFPGPLLRLTEGKQALIDVDNDHNIPQQLQWHGQTMGADVDGAAEKSTPYILAHGTRRLSFKPSPTGFRFYHTHPTRWRARTDARYPEEISEVDRPPLRFGWR